MAMTIADYENEGVVAEKLLIEKSRKGFELNLVSLPPEGGIVPEVRADLIRLLMLEESSLHPAGIQLYGVRITGTLDLRFATCRGGLTLQNCRFDEAPQLGRCKIPELSLDGSHFPGLDAQGMEVAGTLFLNKIICTGTIDLVGARVARQFELTEAQMGQEKGHALSAQSLHVGTIFMFRDMKKIEGAVDLATAYVRDLSDDLASWQLCDEFILNGFTYDRISGDAAPTSFEARMGWLEKGSRAEGMLSPQPYTQFAKVMRASGHVSEARKALMERERLIAQQAIKNTPDKAMWLLMKVKDSLHRWSLGYGHAIHRALPFALIIFVPIAALSFHYAYAEGAMVPNSDVILTSPSWLWALMTGGETPTLAWDDGAVARHYETFYALPYAFDVFVPLVDLGQQSAWRATTVTWTGWVARMGTMLLEVLGWFAGTLAAVSVTGLIQRNDPE